MDTISREIERLNNAILKGIYKRNITAEYQLPLFEELSAMMALQNIVDINGGLTDNQINSIIELIEGGFIKATDSCTLTMTN